MLCVKFCSNCLSGSREEDENEKKLTDRQATDKAKESLKPSPWATVGKPC